MVLSLCYEVYILGCGAAGGLLRYIFVRGVCFFSSKKGKNTYNTWLDHLLVMTSYDVTMATKSC